MSPKPTTTAFGTNPTDLQDHLGPNNQPFVHDNNQSANTTIVISSYMSHMMEAFNELITTSWSLVTSSPLVTTPFIVLFVLPAVICILIYFSAMFLYFYHRKDIMLMRLRKAYEDHNVYEAGMELLSSFWDFLGWFWFGYDIEGLDNIPESGPAMIIFYHGALPIDYYFLVSKHFLLKRRIIHTVTDRFIFKIWGMSTFLKAFHCTPGSQESLTEELKNGHIIGLSPGGVFEAQFGDSNYEIMWRKRVGFAKVALRTKCPVIPIFTTNIRETFRTPGIFRKLLRPIYNWTRLPVVPIYGGFPVKLKTVIGPPVEYDPETCSAEELRDRCKQAMQKLIDDNQKKPGSIPRAIYQRFCRDTATHAS